VGNRLNIPLEILFMGVQFAIFWLLFYKLYYQDSKIKRILLVIFIALWSFFHNIIVGPLFSLPTIIKLIIQICAYTIIVIFAGGKKRNVYITATYYWSVSLLIDLILTCFFVNFTAMPVFSNNVTYYVGTSIEHIALFVWAVFFYSVMYSAPQEALNRISLRFWLIVLLAPVMAAAVFIYAIYSLRERLKADFNNFLFSGVLGIVLLFFDLFVFYLFVKLVTALNSKLLAGELNKTPPVYTPQNGLSAEFIEKYDLTKRQAEIAAALLQGKSNKEIAVLLDIEVNTVQVHLQNVYQKTGAPGRYALMALVGLGK